MQASWNGHLVAESDDTVVVEGNHYFPLESVQQDYLRPSPTTTYCGWKGECSYYHLVVDGQENPDAVWQYADPFPAAEKIRDRVAFWKGVTVSERI